MAVKYFCDRCGNEMYHKSHVHETTIPNVKGSQSFGGKTIQLCASCKKEADRLYDVLTDISFALFKDFVRKDAEK